MVYRNSQYNKITQNDMRTRKYQGFLGFLVLVTLMRIGSCVEIRRRSGDNRTEKRYCVYPMTLFRPNDLALYSAASACLMRAS